MAQKTPPNVERGDEVYFASKYGHHTGKVLSRGEHGVICEVNGKRHKVRHEQLLGHKVRVQPRVEVIDEGEDGFLVRGEDGRKRFVFDPVPTEPEVEPTPTLAKADLRPIILFGAPPEPELMAKALANRPGLALQTLTDKKGHQTKRWKRTAPKEKKERRKAAPEAGARHGYGTHNLNAGDHVQFKAGDFEGEGKIVGEPGQDGAHVQDKSGRQHQVLWSEITGHNPPAKEKNPAPTAGGAGGGGDDGEGGEPGPTITPEKFNAVEYAKSKDDSEATPESILADFPPDTAQKIAEVQKRLASIEETIKTHKQSGRYDAERKALHRKIIYDGIRAKVRNEDTGEMEERDFPGLLSEERIKAATPADGEAPTFTLLGGRGGSGKSWFKNKVYDPDKAIVLDSDHIKGLLPEYEGWNAAQVHEESAEIMRLVTEVAQATGLNIVHDATMNDGNKAEALVKKFKDDGYRVEAHYMHLPRQEAAKRAVDRFLGQTQRYVPVNVVLDMTSNEDSFDRIRPLVDKWSFRDNNVPRHSPPILVSEGDGEK